MVIKAANSTIYNQPLVNGIQDAESYEEKKQFWLESR